MSTLAEIQAAAESLPPEQKEELFRFLATRLNDEEQAPATLVRGPHNTLLLEAPPEAPPMTTEIVKRLLEEFP